MAPIIGTLDKRALRHSVRYADLALVDFDALDETLLQFAFEFEVLVIRQYLPDHNFTLRNRSALPTTDSELRLIAILAQTGEINSPKTG